MVNSTVRQVKGRMRTMVFTPLQKARQQRMNHRHRRQVSVFSQMRPSFSRVAKESSTASAPTVMTIMITAMARTVSQRLLGRPSTVEMTIAK